MYQVLYNVAVSLTMQSVLMLLVTVQGETIYTCSRHKNELVPGSIANKIHLLVAIGQL